MAIHESAASGNAHRWATLLLDLPTELLLMIFKYVDEQSLRCLAFLYRPLHYLILPLVLKGIPDPEHLSSQTLALHNRETMSALPILRRIPSVSSLKRVRCRLTYSPRSAVPSRTETIRNTLGLRFLVENVTKVEEIWIGLPTDYYDADWEKAFAELLHAMASKQCTSFTTVCYDRNMAHPEFDLQLCHFRSFFISPFVRRGRKSDYFVDLNVGKPRNWTAWQLLPLPVLTTFAIESPLFIYTPFLDWTLSTLHRSSSSITTLHLSHLASRKQWAQILPRITLFTLADFKIVSADLAFIDLMRFISRHLTITTLYFLQYSSISIPQSMPIRLRIKKIAMPNLTILSASPTFIHFLLGPGTGAQYRFPLLQAVEIIQYDDEPNYVNQAFQSLAPICQAKQMSLFLTLGRGYHCSTWLSIGPGIRAERLLMVHHLVLRDHVSTALTSETTFRSLPRWLGLFPAVRHVSFHLKILEDTAAREVVAFVRSISEACPLVETITIGTRTSSVEAWLTTDEG